jgi:hypothetical protein
MNNADHRGIGRENTSPHGNHDGEAKNQRHEQRDHEATLFDFNYVMPQPATLLSATRRGFFTIYLP